MRFPAAVLLVPFLAGCRNSTDLGGRFWIEAGAWRPAMESDATPGYGGPADAGGAGPGGTAAVGAIVDRRIRGSDASFLLGWEIRGLRAASERREGDDEEKVTYWNFDAMLSAGGGWTPADGDRNLVSGEFLLGFSAAGLSLDGPDGNGDPAGVRFDMDERLVGGRIRASPWPGFGFRFEVLRGSIQENSGGPYDVPSDGQGGASWRWLALVVVPWGDHADIEAGWKSVSVDVENDVDHAGFRATGPWIGIRWTF